MKKRKTKLMAVIMAALLCATMFGAVPAGAATTQNGVCKASDGNWYYYKDGKKDTSYTGFASNANGKWYVEKGKVTFNKNSVIKDTTGAIGAKGTWYYVTGSKVQENFTGLANYSNENGWWYIKNGKVDFTHNGVDKNKNGWYYVTGGKVQFGFTGLANYKNENGWWYISSGKVNFNAHGVYKNKNGWFYVDGGNVPFSFSGYAANDNGVWYINKGQVGFSSNFTKTEGKATYKVSGGKASVSKSSLVSWGSDSNRSEANNYVCKVPANVVWRFIKGGGQINYVDKFTISNTPSTGKQMGYLIELSNSAQTPYKILPHEIGHFVDWYAAGRGSGMYSNNTEFKNIMNSEITAYRKTFKDRFMESTLTKSSTTTTTEYFADAFSMYCRYNSDLKSSCPKTYSYIKKVINLV